MTKLLEADDTLARHLLIATSRSPTPESWWLSAGDPLMLFESPHALAEALPQSGNSVTAPTDGPGIRGVKLDWLPLIWNGRRLGIWVIQRSRLADPRALRRLRISLLRIHAERECLKQVLRLINSRQIPVRIGTAESDALQDYLNRATRQISLADSQGVVRRDVVSLAYGADSLVTENQKTTILAILEQIRPNVRRKVAALPVSEVIEPAISIVAGSINITGAAMTDNSINTGAISGTVGAIGHGATVTESFKAIEKGSAPEELKALLRDLVTQVVAVSESLAPDDANQILTDSHSLVVEASSPQPRRSTVQALGEALSTATEGLAVMGPPIVDLIEKILRLVA